MNITIIAYKVYFKIRSRISGRLFFFIERYFLSRCNSLGQDTFVRPGYFFYPVEVQLNQRAQERKQEQDEVNQHYKSGTLRQFLLQSPKLERNKAFKINAFYPLFSIAPVDKLESLSQNDRTLIKTFILEWIDLFLRRGRANEFCWYDMAYSYRLIFFYLVRSNSDRFQLSTAELKKVDYSIRVHESLLLEDGLLTEGNHRIFQILARILIGEVHADESYFTREKEHLGNFCRAQFSDEGLHLEHSPEYHLWASYIFQTVFSNYSNMAGIDKLMELASFNSSMFITPDKTIPLIGDSSFDNIGSYILIFDRGNLNTTSFSKDYLIEKNDGKGWHFISNLSANSSVHKHHDSASFELYVAGRKVVSDAGKYQYSKDELSRAIRDVESHNLAFLPEEKNLFTKSFYSLIHEEKLQDITMVAISSSAADKTHYRSFIYDRESFLVVVDRFEGTDLPFSSNLTLTNGATYFRKAGSSGAIFLSESTGFEVALLNCTDSQIADATTSEYYGKVKTEKKLACTAREFLITTISESGKLKIEKLNDGGFKLFTEAGSVSVVDAGKKITLHKLNN